ncbi:MAG TPA: GNAT family protein [Mycobacteriales bacterium]|jgi:ribosomal-protein-alanine N-acetyltransferase|nr:GNAT family protein [Mycobacteriales bacterium]
MAAPGWPAKLHEGRVGLRPLRTRDAARWSDLRTRDEQWLAPWEGRPPGAPEVSWSDRHSPAAYGAALRVWRREAKAGRALPFGITYDGELVGQVTVMNIVLGAFRSGAVGYWVASEVAGRGVTPTAVALLVDHCFDEVGLHRLEVNIRPENAPSLRVVHKLGFREEAQHERYLFIDGAWRDHLSFALTADEVPDGLLTRWRSAQRA